LREAQDFLGNRIDNIVADAIAAWGSDAQKARWLPGLAAGEVIGTIASTEGATVLPIAPATTASGGRIRGVKLAVTDARRKERRRDRYDRVGIWEE
jgi:alkylation response protein AidB-like acyl-CoA dehydrogenase